VNVGGGLIPILHDEGAVRPDPRHAQARLARGANRPPDRGLREGKGARHRGGHGVVCSMSRSGNVWDNAAMESFFSSLKTERTARKIYRSRDEAKADVFDYIERFYNPKRRHSTIGYMSPMEFERQVGLA
jgi:transposase InsO family protein